MKRKSTFVRYFISYFIILCVLLTSFVIVIQTQLTQTYSEQLQTEVDKRLTIVQEQFTTNLNFIRQAHNQLKKDSALINYRHNTNAQNRLELYHELCQYDACNSFVNCIVYLNKTDENILSTKYAVQYTDDVFSIYDGGRKKAVSFDMTDHRATRKNALFFLPASDTTYLLYLPNDTGTKYTFIYMIDFSELTRMLKDNMIEGMTSFAFINMQNQETYGIHGDDIKQIANEQLTTTGIYPYNNKGCSLYLHTNVYEDYSLAALFSNEAFSNQLYAAFRTAYLLLLAISILGFILIFLSMRLTYFPLAKLTHKIIPQPEASQGYIEQLDNIFSTTLLEKQQLQEKIKKYHLSIQKSLLDSGIGDSIDTNISVIKNIDQIFHTHCENCIYMVRIHFDGQDFPVQKIQHFLESRLPASSLFTTLETGAHYSVFVVNYIEKEQNTDNSIYALMMELHREWGCYCAISNSVSSLIDIPSLYENTLSASSTWTISPVAFYSEDTASDTDIPNSIYPYKLLNRLNENLDNLDFSKTHELLEQLMLQTEQLLLSESNYPDFIVRCLLSDILMTLLSSMNQHDIKFKLYNELYFETLYYCRSCNLQEKMQVITDNLFKLLELFQLEMHQIRPRQIQDYLEQNYSSEDLSIATMADYFHVSFNYMSFLFKKEFGENFIDYLWKIRFEKASDMLLHTDMSIDNIGISVGYINSSSFCRKFKQKTGMTPTQYREAGSTSTHAF